MITADPNGGFDVTDSHAYVSGGNGTITVNVTSMGGGTLTTTSAIVGHRPQRHRHLHAQRLEQQPDGLRQRQRRPGQRHQQ